MGSGGAYNTAIRDFKLIKSNFKITQKNSCFWKYIAFSNSSTSKILKSSFDNY